MSRFIAVVVIVLIEITHRPFINFKFIFLIANSKDYPNWTNLFSSQLLLRVIRRAELNQFSNLRGI